MSDGLEEEIAIQDVSLDQHDSARGYDVEEGDDVEHTNDVENDIPWASQGLSKLRHHDYCGSVSNAAIEEGMGVIEDL